MAPSTPSPPEVNIASHSIEMMTRATVLTDLNNVPQLITLTGEHGVKLVFPGFAYPFVKNGVEVLAIVSLVQVTKVEHILKPGGLIV